MTQSPSRSDRTLLEDTMVVVFSEFSLTWWRRGDDHWQHTSALFAGGGIGRSRSVGNFTSDNQFAAGGYGVPVNIQEETGSTSSRVPTAADFVSTIYRGMGMEMDDFFIPGGYGEILGVREST